MSRGRGEMEDVMQGGRGGSMRRVGKENGGEEGREEGWRGGKGLQEDGGSEVRWKERGLMVM